MKEMKKEHELGYVGTFLGEVGTIPTQEKLSQKRREICNECDRLGQMTIDYPDYGDAEVGDTTCSIEWKKDEFDVCMECGCKIDEKVTDLTGICPLYKWFYSYEDWVEYTLPFIQRAIDAKGPYPVKWQQAGEERKRKLAEEKAAQEQAAQEQKEE